MTPALPSSLVFAKGRPAPRWATNLVRRVCDDAGVEAPEVVAFPANATTMRLGGRWIPAEQASAHATLLGKPRANPALDVLVYLAFDRSPVVKGRLSKPALQVEHAEVVHECVHHLRGKDGDREGRHDDAFYRLLARAYEHYDVPYGVATFVEDEVPSWWHQLSW